MSAEQEIMWYDAPFRGLIDNVSVSPGPGYVRNAQNFFLEAGVYRGRPGTVMLGLLDSYLASDPDLGIGTIDPATIKHAAFTYLIDGVEHSIVSAEIAFTAVTDDIADPDADPREAIYVLSYDENEVPTITKGATAAAGAAVAPVTPPGEIKLGEVLIQHDGTAIFDATTDSLAAGHLTVTYDDAIPRSIEAIQALAMYQERASGDRHRIVFMDGAMYEYDFTTDTFALVDTTGVTIDPDALLDWCVFNDHLIVTDGVNQPWSWDGTTFTELADAPIARCCTVYYLKLFFGDLPSAPSTFMWSEEADETIGYQGPHPDGGNYDNTWVFGQVDSDRILRLVGLNEALIVFKEDSIAAVRGAVEPDFQTTGTREGISTTHGLLGPRAFTVIDDDIYYLSIIGPRVIRGGVGPPVDLARERIPTFWGQLVRSTWDDSIAEYDPHHDHVLWGVPRSTTGIDTILCYARKPYELLGLPDQGFSHFKGWSPVCFGRWEDDLGNEMVVYGDTDGNVYRYAREKESLWDDHGTSVRRILRSCGVGRAEEGHKNFDRFDFLFRSITAPEITVRPITDGRAGTGITRTVATGGEVPLWGVAIWGVSQWGRTGGELIEYTRGLNREGYECAWEVSQDQLGAALDVVGVRTWATQVHGFPALVGT